MAELSFANNGTGTLNVSGGTASFFGVAIGFNGQGTVNQTGGLTSSNWFDVGVVQDARCRRRAFSRPAAL